MKDLIVDWHLRLAPATAVLAVALARGKYSRNMLVGLVGVLRAVADEIEGELDENRDRASQGTVVPTRNRLGPGNRESADAEPDLFGGQRVRPEQENVSAGKRHKNRRNGTLVRKKK